MLTYHPEQTNMEDVKSWSVFGQKITFPESFEALKLPLKFFTAQLNFSVFVIKENNTKVLF